MNKEVAEILLLLDMSDNVQSEVVVQILSVVLTDIFSSFTYVATRVNLTTTVKVTVFLVGSKRLRDNPELGSLNHTATSSLCQSTFSLMQRNP